MAKNHYTAGVTQLGKDCFIVSGLVVKRSFPRAEGVVGGVKQVYKDDQGKVLGYTLADVRKVAEARQVKAPVKNLFDAARAACHDCGVPWIDPRTGQAVPPPEEKDDGISIVEINALIRATQKQVKACPCCASKAKLRTYDYMTFGIECSDRDCRLKVERGVVNERGPEECLKMVLTAWNRRDSTD